MRVYFFLVLFISSIGTVSAQDKEMLYIPWPTEWELVENHDDGKRTDLQFYAKGQDVKNWKQAGLISVLHNKKIDNLEEFMFDNNSVLLANCEKQAHKLIKHNAQGKNPYIMYSFHYANCGKGADGSIKQKSTPQAWLCMVVQGKTDVFIAQYGEKHTDNSAIDDATLNEWIKILANGRIINMPSQDQK
jgi:hypothetical protein